MVQLSLPKNSEVKKGKYFKDKTGSKNLRKVNVYRWDQPLSILEQWAEVSSKPIYFAELGSDSYMTITRDIYEEGVSELAQSDANSIMLNDVLNNIELSAGIVVFQFVDGLWKAGNPERQDVGGWAPNSSGVPYDGTANEEFFGLVDINRNKKMSYESVKEIFNNFNIEEAYSGQ